MSSRNSPAWFVQSGEALKLSEFHLFYLHSHWLWIKRHTFFLFSGSRCWREHHQPTWREKSELGFESPEVIFFITLKVDQHDVLWAPHRRRNWETTQESYKGRGERTKFLPSAVKYFSAGPISQIRKRSSLSLNHLRKVESRFWEKNVLNRRHFGLVCYLLSTTTAHLLDFLSEYNPHHLQK